MKPKWIYLLCSFVGAILPYSQFIPWVSKNGLNLRLLISDLFANRISAFFGIDVILSALVVAAFIAIERRRQPMRLWWLPVLATLGVGVSLGLPLFLYLRELNLERPLCKEIE